MIMISAIVIMSLHYLINNMAKKGKQKKVWKEYDSKTPFFQYIPELTSKEYQPLPSNLVEMQLTQQFYQTQKKAGVL